MQLPTPRPARGAPGLLCAALALTAAAATLATPAAPATNGIAATQRGQHRVRAVAAASTHVLLLAGDAEDEVGTTTWAQRSVDGGRTWSAALSPRLAGHAIVSVVAVGDHLLQSADAGASWSFVGEIQSAPDATAVAQRWSDYSTGVVTLRQQQPGAGCHELTLKTTSAGEAWSPAGAPTSCAVTAGACSASVAGATYTWPRCGGPLEGQLLQRRRGARTEQLAVTGVDLDNVYAALRAGAQGVVVGNGERLQVQQTMLAQLAQQADGTLHAHLGAVDGMQDCASGGKAPAIAVTLAVGADALAPVVGEAVKLEHDDGSALLLAAGALLTKRPDGTLAHRFLSAPSGQPVVEVALPGGGVRVADRFVMPGPAPAPAAPFPDSAPTVNVEAWGGSTLLGQRVEPDVGDRPHDPGFIRFLGPWEHVWRDGRRAWVVDGCATAAVALGGDAATASGGGLGTVWRRNGADIAAGTPLSSESGAAVGLTGAWQQEPADAFGLGGGGAPPVKVLADGRRCGALASGWLARADGSPWLVCWPGSRS
jgi:hypothetical protein